MATQISVCHLRRRFLWILRRQFCFLEISKHFETLDTLEKLLFSRAEENYFISGKQPKKNYTACPLLASVFLSFSDIF